MKASTRRGMAMVALALAAGLAGALPSAAAAQETPDHGYGHYQPSPPATAPPDTYPPTDYPPMTYPPMTYPPMTYPPATYPGTPLVSTPPPPPETTPPPEELPHTGVRGMTLAGGGLVLIGIGILAWVFAGRRRIRT